MSLVGKEAPDFNVKAVINGGEIVDSYTLSQHRGKICCIIFLSIRFYVCMSNRITCVSRKIRSF